MPLWVMACYVTPLSENRIHHAPVAGFIAAVLISGNYVVQLATRDAKWAWILVHLAVFGFFLLAVSVAILARYVEDGSL